MSCFDLTTFQNFFLSNHFDNVPPAAMILVFFRDEFYLSEIILFCSKFTRAGRRAKVLLFFQGIYNTNWERYCQHGSIVRWIKDFSLENQLNYDSLDRNTSTHFPYRSSIKDLLWETKKAAIFLLSLLWKTCICLNLLLFNPWSCQIANRYQVFINISAVFCLKIPK